LKPADFHYHRPRTTKEALSLLKGFGEEGKVLAGGQSLMPLMNFRLAQPAHIIDINFIDGLDYIKSDSGFIKIGCLARQSRLLGDSLVRQRCPLLANALAYVGHEQTRNRGTFCGSLAHADPAAELPAVLLASSGVFRAAGSLTGAVLAGLPIVIPSDAFVAVAAFVYATVSHALAGATLGKRLAGIRVVGPDGRPPGIARSAARSAWLAVSIAAAGLGLLPALLLPSRRALHDLLAGTRVVEGP